MAEDKTDILKEEVETYCSELFSYTNEKEILLQLDNPIFRALLYGRRSQANNNHIDLKIDATEILPEFPVKNYQMVEIFDNLMDNAFECVETLQNNRWITVMLQCERKNNGSYQNVLCIENPYENIDIEAFSKHAHYTTKGGDHKGIGLHKVEQLVSATGGKLVISFHNHVFSTKIVYES